MGPTHNTFSHGTKRTPSKQNKSRSARRSPKRRTGKTSERGTTSRAVVLNRPIKTTQKHTFQRTVSYNTVLNELTGWAASGIFDIEFTFSLASTFIYIGGAFVGTIPNPGSSEFTPLFERWRIVSVEATPIFTGNSSSLNSPTTALPLILCVIDYDDTAAISLTQIQQYSNMMMFQLGTGAVVPPTIKFSPRPLAIEYSGVSPGYAITSKNVELNTGYPAIPHYGLKCVFDNQNVSSASLIGTVSWYFRYTFELSIPK